MWVGTRLKACGFDVATQVGPPFFTAILSRFFQRFFFEILLIGRRVESFFLDTGLGGMDHGSSGVLRSRSIISCSCRFDSSVDEAISGRFAAVRHLFDGRDRTAFP